MALSEARRQGFSPGTPVSSSPSSVSGSTNQQQPKKKKKKEEEEEEKGAKINAISTLSNLIAEPSLRTMWHVTRHVARNERSMCCT